MFATGLCIHVMPVSVDDLSRGGVLVLSQYRTAGFSRQDDKIIGQDGKCDRQAVEIHNRTVSRWAEPRSGYKVVEGQ